MNLNLKQLREQKRITQTQVAKDLKMPIMTYHSYEKNINQPNIETLIKLADYYNVSIDYLVGRNYTNQLGYITKNELAFIQLYLTLNELNKEKIACYLSGLIAGQN